VAPRPPPTSRDLQDLEEIPRGCKNALLSIGHDPADNASISLLPQRESTPSAVEVRTTTNERV
jgi:hypothetical protein